MIPVPQRWASLVAQLNGDLVGVEGVRDPEHPCEAFVPGLPDGNCEIDGHYMCDECTQMKRCECGRGRPSHCENEPDCLFTLRAKTDDAIEAMKRAGQWFEMQERRVVV